MTEAKASPSLRPLQVFLTHLGNGAAVPADELRALDGALIDFATYRGAERQGGGHLADARGDAPPPPQLPWVPRPVLVAPPTTTTAATATAPVRKNRVILCDGSILLHRQLASLAALAESPHSRVLCVVFPFSALLLARFQAAQGDAVSAAFRVGAYSQLRQLGQLAAAAAPTAAAAGEATARAVPPVCVLPPSVEVALRRGWGAETPDAVAAAHCVAGEAAWSAHSLPLLAVQAQRAFGAAPGTSCVACAGSAHRAVQSACLRRGIFCDSLAADAAPGDDGGAHRMAAELCRSYARKLRAVGARLWRRSSG